MRADALVSLVIYTGATVAFYLLGAAVLHKKNLVVGNDDMIPTLSNIYSESFGSWGLAIFLVGAFAVLYSTVFISTATNARLFADFGRVFGILRADSEEARSRVVRWTCLGLPFVYFIFYMTVGKPVHLVFAGALAQALMLPFLAAAALYFLHCRTPVELKPNHPIARAAWAWALWISAALMGAVGLYQLIDKLKAGV